MKSAPLSNFTRPCVWAIALGVIVWARGAEAAELGSTKVTAVRNLVTLKRVQVKSNGGAEDGIKNRTKLKFYALRGNNVHQASTKRLYGKNEVDAFVFFNTKQNAIFVVPFDKLPKTQSVYFAPNCEWRDNWDVLRNSKRG